MHVKSVSNLIVRIDPFKIPRNPLLSWKRLSKGRMQSSFSKDKWTRNDQRYAPLIEGNLPFGPKQSKYWDRTEKDAYWGHDPPNLTPWVENRAWCLNTKIALIENWGKRKKRGKSDCWFQQTDLWVAERRASLWLHLFWSRPWWF